MGRSSIHTTNRRKLARAILTEEPFVVSFAGTSVTAGHDNLFEESYPMVFARALEPVFEAAGVELTVRNHAMGNNPAIPSAFCVGAQLGEDTDVAVWEFGMMVRCFKPVSSKKKDGPGLTHALNNRPIFPTNTQPL